MAVASNVADAPALERARSRMLATKVFPRGDYVNRAERDATMGAWLGEQGVRLVVLAGYMELLSPAFLDRFPDAVINVHPSLLPAFPGLHAVEQALTYGVTVFGVTVHFVDAGLDSGPVILQRAVELPGANDPDTVLESLRPLEHTLLPQAVRLFARGALSRDAANPRRVLVAPQGAAASPRGGLTQPMREAPRGQPTQPIREAPRGQPTQPMDRLRSMTAESRT